MRRFIFTGRDPADNPPPLQSFTIQQKTDCAAFDKQGCRTARQANTACFQTMLACDDACEQVSRLRPCLNESGISCSAAQTACGTACRIGIGSFDGACLNKCRNDFRRCKSPCDNELLACKNHCARQESECRIPTGRKQAACDQAILALRTECRQECIQADNECKSACSAAQTACVRPCNAALNDCQQTCGKTDVGCFQACRDAQAPCFEKCRVPCWSECNTKYAIACPGVCRNECRY